MKTEDNRSQSDPHPHGDSTDGGHADARIDALRRALQEDESKERLAAAYEEGELTEEQLIRFLGREQAQKLIEEVRSREQ